MENFSGHQAPNDGCPGVSQPEDFSLLNSQSQIEYLVQIVLIWQEKDFVGILDLVESVNFRSNVPIHQIQTQNDPVFLGSNDIWGPIGIVDDLTPKLSSGLKRKATRMKVCSVEVCSVVGARYAIEDVQHIFFRIHPPLRQKYDVQF